MNVADGESRRLACHMGVSSHQSCSTFTLMTSQSDGTCNFIYADDLCVTAQYSSFTEVETTIGDALDELTQYYRSNSLRANPNKTQVTAFHMRNKEDSRSLKVEWNRTAIENTPHPKYLCVTLDRTLSYKERIHNIMMKGGHHATMAPNDTAYKRWSCHSGAQAEDVQIVSNLPRPPAMGGPIYSFLGMRTRWMAGAAAHKSG